MSVESKLISQTNAWDIAASVQAERQGETGDIVRQLFYDPIVSQLVGDVSGQIVLDAGCGNGYWSRRLAKDARHVVGVDNSLHLLRCARENDNPVNVTYCKMDLANRMGIQDRTVDMAISNIVLDYVPTIDIFATKCARIIKPNGTLVIGVQHPLDNKSRDEYLQTNPPPGKPFKRKIYEGQVEVVLFNRDVNDYIDPFLRSGFSLAYLTEPLYPQELLRIKPEYKLREDIPRFLFLKYVR